MGLAFRLMIFMLLLNIAIGIIDYSSGTPGSWTSSGMSSDTYISDASKYNTFNQSITMPAENAQNFWYRFLDIISLGLFNKIRDMLNSTIFAFPQLLTNIGVIPSGFKIFLNSILTLIYTIGTFELFTGKDITLR